MKFADLSEGARFYSPDGYSYMKHDRLFGVRPNGIKRRFKSEQEVIPEAEGEGRARGVDLDSAIISA